MKRLAFALLGVFGALAAYVVASFVVAAAAEREYTNLRPEMADSDDEYDPGYTVYAAHYDFVNDRYEMRPAYRVNGAGTADYTVPGPSSTCTSQSFQRNVTWT